MRCASLAGTGVSGCAIEKERREGSETVYERSEFSQYILLPLFITTMYLRFPFDLGNEP